MLNPITMHISINDIRYKKKNSIAAKVIFKIFALMHAQFQTNNCILV